jgi:succinate dehydrogenase / fumarate reductase cytochrome b subunit
MSAIAFKPVGRAVGFYEAPIGKKAVMAVTGLMLFGYVVAHLVGNLQIYAGPDQINRYAAFLHAPASQGFLWGARSVLAACVVLHVLASIQLWFQKRAARPIAYTKKDDAATSYAARTMMWSGPIVAAFVVFHILHLTVGSVRGLPVLEVAEHEPNVYANVVAGFSNPLVAGFYILAIALLSTHLYHGVWSLFQSLGADHPRYTPCLRRLAKVVAILIAAGNISIPVAVMAGVIQ